MTENSPAYWHTGFTKTPNDTTIEFTYQFLNPGDGDQLGLWIDDQLRFIITGELVGTDMLTSDIDIFDLSDGDHILSIALHNYGDANASVQVLDFMMLSVSLPGDFNGDNSVDAADYVVWRKTGGTQEAYNVWRTHFGQTVNPAAVADSFNQAIPEPASLALLLLGTTALCMIPRPGRKRKGDILAL